MPKRGEKVKIKKVDEKPMVLHVKEKSKIHTHKRKREADGRADLREVSREADKGKMLRKNSKKMNQPVIKKKKSLYNAGMLVGQMAADQAEGGKELQQAAIVMYEASKPVTGTASRGAELFKKRALEKKKQTIKKVEAGRKISRKTGKVSVSEDVEYAGKEVSGKRKMVSASNTALTTENSSISQKESSHGYSGGKSGLKRERSTQDRDNRVRKLAFFLDKMKAEENQTDSVGKVAKDIVFRQAGEAVKKIVAAVLPFLLVLVLLVSMLAIPVVAVVGVAYNSPFAIFLPSLEEGDTVTTVASAYIADFNRAVSTEETTHTGCDEGRIVYVNYEGADTNPSNFYDILAVYMVKYGVGDTATIMNDTSREWLQSVVDDMCSYTTSEEVETEEITDQDGNTESVTTTYLNVNVTLKTWRDMIAEYEFDSNEQEMLTEFMRPDYLAMLGYVPGGGGGNMQSALSAAEINHVLSEISDSTQKAVCSYALNRVGYPYSQDLRDSGQYYDCSSLVYYSWQSAGVNIGYGGATTAAAEAQGLNEAGKAVNFSELEPGDLIFYSTSHNGRYMNITHVAVYVGNGKAVEALNENYGVVYQDMRTSNVVLMCRPGMDTGGA